MKIGRDFEEGIAWEKEGRRGLGLEEIRWVGGGKDAEGEGIKAGIEGVGERRTKEERLMLVHVLDCFGMILCEFEMFVWVASKGREIHREDLERTGVVLRREPYFHSILDICRVRFNAQFSRATIRTGLINS
jgi:hypothetical protein